MWKSVGMLVLFQALAIGILFELAPRPACSTRSPKKEILDLLAYLESLGDSTHPNFKK